MSHLLQCVLSCVLHLRRGRWQQKNLLQYWPKGYHGILLTRPPAPTQSQLSLWQASQRILSIDTVFAGKCQCSTSLTSVPRYPYLIHAYRPLFVLFVDCPGCTCLETSDTLNSESLVSASWKVLMQSFWLHWRGRNNCSAFAEPGGWTCDETASNFLPPRKLKQQCAGAGAPEPHVTRAWGSQAWTDMKLLPL